MYFPEIKRGKKRASARASESMTYTCSSPMVAAAAARIRMIDAPFIGDYQHGWGVGGGGRQTEEGGGGGERMVEIIINGLFGAFIAHKLPKFSLNGD